MRYAIHMRTRRGSREKKVFEEIGMHLENKTRHVTKVKRDIFTFGGGCEIEKLAARQ